MLAALEIRLLLSDVDGTIVTRDKQLTPATLAAAQALREAGVGLALTSARPPLGLRQLVGPLGLQLPLAGFNGGLIVDPDFSVIESHPIDPDVAERTMRLIRDSGLDLWVYSADAWLVSDPDAPAVARESGIIQMAPEAVPVTSRHLDQVYKIVGVSDDYARIAATGERIRAAEAGAVSATSSERRFIDVTHAEANKGAVVHRLASHLAIDPVAIATIGDMPNDILMFAQSGFSIAMGNAGDEVKAAANAVTATNEEDGFASAVHRFLLDPAAIAPVGDGLS